MTKKSVESPIKHFVEVYVKTKRGQITTFSDQIFKIKYPKAVEQTFTYDPTLSIEKDIPLIAMGSQMFQQILNECIGNGVLCQISLKPKDTFETLLRNYFNDVQFECKDCFKTTSSTGDIISICTKLQPCYHKINNGKITSIKISKQKAAKYYLFYYSVTFHNKLRPKSDEIIIIFLDEEYNIVSTNFNTDSIFENEAICVKDCGGKLKPAVFNALKIAADQKLHQLLKEKLALFDLPLSKEKKARLNSFSMRLRRERREQVVSKKQNFDMLKWQTNYETLLKREEESYLTHITVKLSNLLIVNTSKVKFEINLDNNSTIKSSFTLGVDHDWLITCPICKKTFNEGYATQDSFYVCSNCIKQSIDTGKIYSKKANLALDKTLNEYVEKDAGFVCSVCGATYSRLLEFKCNYDGSSICIHHYGLCDVCGKIFSKLNLSYTDEFRHRLCPQHAKEKFKEH